MFIFVPERVVFFSLKLLKDVTLSYLEPTVITTTTALNE